MTTDKMEPRLAARVEESKRRGMATAAGGPALEGLRHPVLLVLDGRPDVGGDTSDRAAVVTDMADQLRDVAGPVEAAIGELDERHAELMPLARSVRAELTEAEIDAVASRDEITVVVSDHRDEVALLSESTRVIELPDAVSDLATPPGFTATGHGITVAVVDSGIDDSHPALFGRVKDSFDATGGGLSPGAHGTHVAGIVASADPVHRGVAPDAQLINVQVLDAAGFGQPSWVIAGLQQAFLRGAEVVNLSLGWSEIFHGWLCNDADCILCQAIDNVVRLGVVAVVAAGNEGALATPPQHNIRHPGAARGAITVGSVDKDKQLSWFSSIGPGSGQLSPTSPIELTKPDLAAPGGGITSTFPGGTFVALSGTSMASPHVAGMVALLLERDGTLRPRMVRKLLERSCEDLPLGPNQAGYGLVNAYAALM
jgi:subtilisin family serine protease